MAGTDNDGVHNAIIELHHIVWRFSIMVLFIEMCYNAKYRL